MVSVKINKKAISKDFRELKEMYDEIAEIMKAKDRLIANILHNHSLSAPEALDLYHDWMIS